MEGDGTGFLEGDETAGEHQEGEVVLGLFGPADEQRPVTVQPRVAGLDHPASGAPAGRLRLDLDLLAAGPDVGRVAMPDRNFLDWRRVLAAVQTQPWWLLWCRTWPLEGDAFKRRF